MIILGIESSCDETAAAILRKDGDKIEILSNVVASSVDLQTKWGGIVPEQAAREQLKSIIPVIEEAIYQASEGWHGGEGSRSRGLIRSTSGLKDLNDLSTGQIILSMKSKYNQNLTQEQETRDRTPSLIENIDAIAVTQGPGLIGSLLVGVETAKTLSLAWQKPLIPVNHLIGHFYANFINQPSSHDPTLTAQNSPSFPCIGLLVSGGHTDLVLFKAHNKYEYLGGTRDDAAGECFDKCARILGLAYPGGPEISKHAQNGNPTTYALPKPMLNSNNLDFSFSGLKTAVLNLVTELKAQDSKLTSQQIADLSASIEQAICQVLVKKTLKAAKIHNTNKIMVAGGVAANQTLTKQLITQCSKLKAKLFIPPPSLCTDNAAMIVSAALFQKPIKNPLDLQANPNLSLSIPTTVLN